MENMIIINGKSYPHDKKIPEKSEDKPVREVSEPVRMLSDACPTAVRDASEDVLEPSEFFENLSDGHIQTLKAARNASYHTPVNLFGSITTFFLLLSGLIATLNNLPWRYQTAIYITCLVVTVLTDAFGLFGRILAPQSRILFSGSCILLTLNFYMGNIGYKIVSFFLTIIFLYLIRNLNYSWLFAYNYLLSASCQKVIANNPKSKAVKAWMHFGIRETKALAYEMGITVNSFSLEKLKYFWILGYNAGWTKTEKGKKKIEKLQEKYETLQADHEQVLTDLLEAKRMNKDLKDRIEEAEPQLRELLLENARLERENAELRSRNLVLSKANDEMILSLEDPEEMVSHTEQFQEDEESQIRRLLSAVGDDGNRLYGYRKIAEIVGVKKNTVEKVVAKIKEESRAAESAA